jgi:hypothetical protein
MDYDLRYAAWVQFCSLTREQKNEIIRLYHHIQNLIDTEN